MKQLETTFATEENRVRPNPAQMKNEATRGFTDNKLKITQCSSISSLSQIETLKMKSNSLLMTALVLGFESFVFSQSQSGYPPVARRGHFISNGRYLNHAPQAQNNFQPNNQQASNNVIGNEVENTFGSGAVNSIVVGTYGSAVNSIANPSPGSANNVIGNKASLSQVIPLT